jgi:hypothetical protein
LAFKSGEVFTGVFSGFAQDTSNTAQYRLKMVKRQPHPEYIGEGDEHAMAFDVQDTLSLSASDVPLSSSTSQANGTLKIDFL